MKKTAVMLITTIFLLSCTIMVPFPKAQAEMTFLAWTSTSPTIDGILLPGEWGYADMVAFDLNGRASTLYIMNDATNLYVAARIYDPISSQQAISIEFDNNHNGVGPEQGDDRWYSGYASGGPFALGAPDTYDTYYGSAQQRYYEDYPSSNNVNTHLEFDEGYVTVEFKVPLQSGDIAHDFNLVYGQSIGFQLSYFYWSDVLVGVYPGEYIGGPVGVDSPVGYGDHSTFGDIVVASPPFPTLDTDGDGLFDIWEINGIDNNGDGIIDLILPDSNPYHKDIYVEVDWMYGHRPEQSAIDEIIAVFANAPVSNPDATNGINLHVELSNGFTHTKYITFDRQPGEQDTVDFDDIKTANFDSNRRQAYHYCIFAHRLKEDPITSGQGEIVGNDFMVTLGYSHSYEPYQKGTFMHELGHNLGLLHGGDEHTNHKPNYISNMNYLFQFGVKQQLGLPPIFDWSNGELPDLFELNLNENLGIQGGYFITRFIDPTNPSEIIDVNANGPIDWDQDGAPPYETSVIANINNDTLFGFPILWFLHDYNDWDNLNFRFQDNERTFLDGIHLDVIDPSDEINYYESLLIVSTMYSPVDILENMKVLIVNLEENKFTDLGNVLVKKKALIKKIDEIILKINEGFADEAIDKLTKDIKSKMDGNPKPKDWINDTNIQNTLCSIVDNIIDQLNS